MQRDTQTTTARETVESQNGGQKEVGHKTIPTSQPEVQSVEPSHADLLNAPPLSRSEAVKQRDE